MPRTAREQKAFRAEVPRFGRRLPPIVIAAVDVAHGHFRKLLWIDVVEGREVDGVISAADFLDVAVAKVLQNR